VQTYEEGTTVGLSLTRNRAAIITSRQRERRRGRRGEQARDWSRAREPGADHDLDVYVASRPLIISTEKKGRREKRKEGERKKMSKAGIDALRTRSTASSTMPATPGTASFTR